MGREGFGQLGIIQSTIGSFQVFAGFQLGLTATKHIAQYRNTDPHRAGRLLALSNVLSLCCGLFVAAVLLVSAQWVASNLLAAPDLSGELKMAALLVLLGAVNGAQIGALSGFEAFKSIAMVQTVSGVTTFGLTVAGAYLDGLAGVLWGLAASTAITVCASHFALRHHVRAAGIPVNYSACTSEKRILLNFSLPSLLSNLLVIPVYWICNVMLVHRPGGYGEMGLLNAVNQWRTAYLFLPGVIGQVAVPILSERFHSANPGNIRGFMRKLLVIHLAVGIPLLLVICGLSPWILAGYGSDFTHAWPAFVILQCAALLQVAQAPVIKFWEATGRMWTNFFMNVGWSACVLVLTAILVSKGAFGVCLAQLIAFALFGVALLWFVLRDERYPAHE